MTTTEVEYSVHFDDVPSSAVQMFFAHHRSPTGKWAWAYREKTVSPKGDTRIADVATSDETIQNRYDIPIECDTWCVRRLVEPARAATRFQVKVTTRMEHTLVALDNDKDLWPVRFAESTEYDIEEATLLDEVSWRVDELHHPRATANCPPHKIVQHFIHARDNSTGLRLRLAVNHHTRHGCAEKYSVQIECEDADATLATFVAATVAVVTPFWISRLRRWTVKGKKIAYSTLLQCVHLHGSRFFYEVALDGDQSCDKGRGVCARVERGEYVALKLNGVRAKGVLIANQLVVLYSQGTYDMTGVVPDDVCGTYLVVVELLPGTDAPRTFIVDVLGVFTTHRPLTLGTFPMRTNNNRGGGDQSAVTNTYARMEFYKCSPRQAIGLLSAWAKRPIYQLPPHGHIDAATLVMPTPPFQTFYAVPPRRPCCCRDADAAATAAAADDDDVCNNRVTVYVPAIAPAPASADVDGLLVFRDDNRIAKVKQHHTIEVQRCQLPWLKKLAVRYGKTCDTHEGTHDSQYNVLEFEVTADRLEFVRTRIDKFLGDRRSKILRILSQQSHDAKNGLHLHL